MKKKIIALTLALGIIASVPVYGKVNKEILFRDIPWGTSYTDVASKYLVMDFFNIAGDGFVTCSCDEIIYGQGEGIKFANGDINISSSAYIHKDDDFYVAGYKPTDLDMYYAYSVINKKISKSEDTSLLYGAEYEFEPQDLYGMKEDIKSKLTALYGECDKEKEEKDDWMDRYTTYTTWKGKNTTEIVLKTVEDLSDPDYVLHGPDTLNIIYLWRIGDDLLQKASDAIGEELKQSEATNYGSDNTDGL